MSATAGKLFELLQTVPPRLSAITEAEASLKTADSSWSKKEILGHLIDSAANNHQRFVRMQFAAHIDLPGYEQERWVAVQAYITESWAELVSLWLALNRHFVHILRSLPPAVLENTLSIGGGPAMTLDFVVDDYLRHLEHHLGQIL